MIVILDIGQTKRQFFFSKKENSALSKHACLTNHEIAWENSNIITTNPQNQP